jgi:hypothetical protein
MTTNPTIARPQADEHLPYYSKYIDRVPDGDLVAMLREQLMDTVALLRKVPKDREDYAYGPGKWTIKEVVGHVIDTERVMAYRALSVGRNDPVNLPSFDENAWVPAANFGRLSLAELVEELEVVRAATIQLAKHLDPKALVNRGTANGAVVTPRALFYIIAGHERHHVALFRERYGL